MITSIRHWSPFTREGVVVWDTSCNQMVLRAPCFASIKFVRELPRQVVSPQPYHFLLLAREAMMCKVFFENVLILLKANTLETLLTSSLVYICG